MGSEPPCLREHVKLSVLRLISSRTCRLTVPSDYEREGTESAPVFAHFNISCLVGYSPSSLSLAAVATIEKLASQYPASVVMTGGDAVVLADALSLQSEHRADLVLEGLAIEGVEFAQSLIQ